MFFYYGLETTVKQIEEAFKAFTTREDVAIVMISQYVANMIKFLVDSYNNPIPTILEISSKDHPYDPTHDSVLSRVKYFFSDFPILCVVCLNILTMLVDDIGDITITNDGAILLKMLYVGILLQRWKNKASIWLRFKTEKLEMGQLLWLLYQSSDPADNDAWKDSDREA
ncbi:hypothetical protein HYC85_032144 [Camellia sinensis]|uniref:Uncharacterized protein n=1 Tax=Camellia sinensis TaxID=4442 RepID=A0A7J7FTE5_CAMSI|nr:hypothetical protein HYC85_032144 [Camellia sinensis]